MSTEPREEALRRAADKFWPGSDVGLWCVYRCLCTCQVVREWAWTRIALTVTAKQQDRADELAKLRSGVDEYGWPCMQAEAIAALDRLKQTCPTSHLTHPTPE